MTRLEQTNAAKHATILSVCTQNLLVSSDPWQAERSNYPYSAGEKFLNFAA
jgi:hypothetical protein